MNRACLSQKMRQLLRSPFASLGLISLPLLLLALAFGAPAWAACPDKAGALGGPGAGAAAKSPADGLVCGTRIRRDR